MCLAMFAAEGATALVAVVAVIIGAVLFLGIGVLLLLLFRSKNGNAEIAEIARANNWAFSPVADRQQHALLFHAFPDENNFINVIVREEREFTTIYAHLASSAGRKIPDPGECIVTYSKVLNLPNFSITPRGKIRMTMKSKIPFDASSPLRELLKVHGDDVEAVRRVFTPRATAELSRCGKFWIEAQGNLLTDQTQRNRTAIALIKGLFDLHAFVHQTFANR